MKFNNNNSKKSFTLLTFLSFCAIATSTATAAVEPLSNKEALSPATKQQSENQETQKPFEPISRSNDETKEEIHLDREWEDILGDDESGEEILLARGAV
ncbi:exported hypothetical protein [Hyella patelloides LEGE 07179]|uniref:Uncharacterized protein n=1 Tax=Hyella patelloides LEGE 07179 TaxID=945734 RepID=A0A563VNG8_9CYAN|nr:hypothetical protein [Hyella patelloides]VEP12984.1 exported hypothetical protein [Hyella patelloides LEGE 07179]